MKRSEQLMAGICLGILLIALGALFVVNMGEEPDVELPRETAVRPPAVESVKEPAPQPPISDEAVADFIARMQKHTLRRIGEALAKQPIDTITPDKQRLEDLIARIRKDYTERTARIRARAALPRKPLHGDGEPGNAWDFYGKMFDAIKTMTMEEDQDLAHLADEQYLARQSNEQRQALERRGNAIAEKYRPILKEGLRGARQIRADREVVHPEGSPRDLLSLMYSQYLQHLAAKVIRTELDAGDPAEAMETLTDAILFSQDIMKDGMLIDAMIAPVIQRPLIEETLPGLLARKDLSPALLAKLSRDMNILTENQPSFFGTLDVELAEWEFRTIEGVTGDRKEMDFLLSAKNIDAAMRETGRIPDDTDILRLQIHFAAGILDRATIIDLILGQRKIFDESYPTFQRFLEAESERTATMGNSADDFLPRSAVSREYEIVVRNRALLESAQIAVALKRHRVERGAFPARVDDLYTTGYLPSPSKDPFTGGEWRYAVAPDGRAATVWSVGPNFRDDGGIDNRAEGKDDVAMTVR